MRVGQYYSIRNSKTPGLRSDLSILRRLFLGVFQDFETKGYFQEAVGYYCVDAGDVPGTLGDENAVDNFLFRKLFKDNLWPIPTFLPEYTEDDLFDIIEFLFDIASCPNEDGGYFHSWDGCGWHYQVFDKAKGQLDFREQINEILSTYQDGYELSHNGEIYQLTEKGLDSLFKAQLPDIDKSIEARMDRAIAKYRNRHSDLAERKNAVRELGDILEFLRDKAKNTLSRKDEQDLFQVLNQFGIRHHNPQQKTDYDLNIFTAWLFYYYLSAIHACTRLIDRAERNNKQG
jgi:hypothetical protein